MTFMINIKDLCLQQVGVSNQGRPVISKARQAENEGRQDRLAALGAQDDKNSLSEPLLDH